MKRVAEAAALRSAICARSVCDDLVVFPVSGLLYFKRHASHNARSRAAGRSGHAPIGRSILPVGLRLPILWLLVGRATPHRR